MNGDALAYRMEVSSSFPKYFCLDLVRTVTSHGHTSAIHYPVIHMSTQSATMYWSISTGVLLAMSLTARYHSDGQMAAFDIPLNLYKTSSDHNLAPTRTTATRGCYA